MEVNSREMLVVPSILIVCFSQCIALKIPWEREKGALDTLGSFCHVHIHTGRAVHKYLLYRSYLFDNTKNTKKPILD